jgi:CRISPR/Cas system CMR subunit Cmr4 (Cas7 group RAMP superfamily)
MPAEESKVERLTEKVIEVTTIMNRMEEVIDKLSEISSNLTILVSTNTNRIENINSILVQDRLNTNQSLDRIEKKVDKIETITTKELEDLKRELDKAFVRKESFEPIQRLLFGLVALALAAVGGGILNLIMK